MPNSHRTSIHTPPRSAVSDSSEAQKHPAHDLMVYLKEYARERPEVVALWCFGLGFIVGWKLKPW